MDFPISATEKIIIDNTSIFFQSKIDNYYLLLLRIERGKNVMETDQVVSQILTSIEANMSKEAFDLLVPVLKGISLKERDNLLKEIRKELKRRSSPLLTKNLLINVLFPKRQDKTFFEARKATKKSIEKQNNVKEENRKNLSQFLGKKPRAKNKEKAKQHKKANQERERTVHNPIMKASKKRRKSTENTTRTREKSSRGNKVKQKVETLPKLKKIEDTEQLRARDFKKSFFHFFQNRFETLSKILKRKRLENLVGTTTVNKEVIEDESSIILMISSKRTVKNGEGGLIIGQDREGEIKLFVPLRGSLKEKFNSLLVNSVVACKFYKSGSGLPIVKDILFPNVPYPREKHRANHSTKALFLSDFHIGSKDFLKGVFDTFMNFIRGKTEGKETAKQIDYIFVAGDLVDGVGVYPNQKRELEVMDIKKQYKILYEYLKKIPREKRIILIPGNHDASGRLLPQPAPPFLKEINELENVSLLSNPSLVEIEGVRILLYHGQGFESIAGELGVDINEPKKITKQILKHRHLSPIWKNVSNFPTDRDLLLIKEPPDILATGHLHIADYLEYRGTLLLNPSAFEGKTSWQKELGLEPTPGLFPVIDLQNFNVKFLDFTS